MKQLFILSVIGMMRRVLAATVLLLGTSVVAHAATLASASIHGGPTQDSAFCYIFNAGTTPITFVSKEIIKESGTSLSLTFDNCSVLQPDETCLFFTSIVNNKTHACKVRINEKKTNVRGVLEIREGGATVLSNSEAR